jgi:phosphoribosylformylglycinamidine synthase PurS subunit
VDGGVEANLKFKARIEIGLKGNILDPAADTIRKSLVDLNFPVSATKLAQVYYLTVEAQSRQEAEQSVQLMCSRLLANPVKDEYQYRVEEDGSSISGQPEA